MDEAGTALTFHLHQGIKWHDGKPFTAADVKRTWDALAGKASEKFRILVCASGGREARFTIAHPAQVDDPCCTNTRNRGISAELTKLWGCRMNRARLPTHGSGFRLLVVTAFLGLTLCPIAASHASVIADTPDPLPPGGVLVGTSGGAGCFPAVGVCAEVGTLTYSNVTSSIMGSNQILGFSAALTVPFTDLSMTQVLGTATLTGSGSETVFGRTSALESGTFNTQITSLDLMGAFNGIPLAVTQDTSNASTGQTTITPLGEQFVITSFFDIFVDIQLSTTPPLMTTRGPLVAVLEPVPEPTGLALIVLPLAALAILRRPRASFRCS